VVGKVPVPKKHSLQNYVKCDIMQCIIKIIVVFEKFFSEAQSSGILEGGTNMGISRSTALEIFELKEGFSEEKIEGE